MRRALVLSATFIPSLAGIIIACGNPMVPVAQDGPSDGGTSAGDTGTPTTPASDAGSEDGGSTADGGDGGSTGALDAAGPIPAAMNDVSILFPLPSSAADIANLLTASSSGARGTLLPSATYSNPEVGPITGLTQTADGGLVGPAGAPFFTAYSDLHVVAMRIDPCFASLAPDPNGVGCTAQIRLILQEVRPAVDEIGPGATGVATFDSAVHAFYSLARDEFLTLARALVALRVANANGVSLGPLAPHPIMVSQGLGGALSKGVEQLILQYAGEQNLTRVAQLSNDENVGLAALHWVVSAANIVDAATAATSPFAIPTLDGGSVQAISAQLPSQPGTAGNFLFAGFLPTTTSTDNLAPLDDGTPSALSASSRQAAFDALVRIENPTYNSPATIDCASCHFVTPTEDLVAMPNFALSDRTNSLAFHPDGKSVVAADMTPTFSVTAGQLNMHAFSYVGQSPAINQRVVNETAAIVEYLNDLPK